MTDLHAGEVTVRQTIALLEGRHSELTSAVADGDYVFWLGSGISRARLAGLDAVVKRVLHRLHEEASAGGPDGEWARALTDAVDLARLSAGTRARIDFALPIEDWECYEELVGRLVGEYSTLLDIPVPPPEPDFLLWNVVDVAQTYGSVEIQPDVEHYCLAALILEGVVPDIVSANWDGLIEQAMVALVGSSDAVAVHVRAEDFRTSGTSSRLLKFHGCAVLALEDPGTYRHYLVARRSQITRWPEDNEHDLMRREMSSLAARKRTLMIGLSGQDTNIQDLFSRARAMLMWTWDTNPPAFAFAEDAIGVDQRAILQVAYGDDYRTYRDETDSSALIRSYAKPLLTALLLEVLSQKLEALAELVGGVARGEPFLTQVHDGLASLIGLVADAMAPVSAERVRDFLLHWGQLLTMFRHGVHVPAQSRFMPISDRPVAQMPRDPGLSVGGGPEFAVALAIIGAEHEAGTWGVDFARSEGDVLPSIRLTAGARTSRLCFAASESVAIRLELTGSANIDDPELVVVHSKSLPHRQQRSPAPTRGRTGRRTVRRIDVATIVEDETDLRIIRRAFREELGI